MSNCFKIFNKSCQHHAHGSVTLLMGKKTVTLYGGSYFSAELIEGVQRVKLAQELDRPYEHKIDIQDFGTPKTEDILELAEFIRHNDHSVYYIGCFGGYGRTGTVIAALLIVLRGFSARYAIDHVRANISPRCIETLDQSEFLYKLSTTLEKMNS
ncbi:hypothetical protein [Vibrio phage vB_VhaS-a]|nr:hypothetical protein [Vibrio phage vB_VhaS-a]